MSPGRPEARPATLGFLGIHSGGRADQARSANETVAELFAASGVRVRTASARSGRVVRTAHQIAALVGWHDVDIVIASVFSGPSFRIAELACALAPRRGRKLVLVLDGGNLPTFGADHHARVERVLARSDLIVAPSGYLAEEFRHWGYDVRVIPNVLDIDAYDFRPRDEPAANMLWMRTFHEHYNPLLAVQVLEAVLRHRPDATLTMGGADHGLLDATRQEAARRGVADRVDFAGYLRGEAKARALAGNDVFLNTNDVDNMPVSVLEAGAAGLVPVATSVGGIPYLLEDGVNGLLAPPRDPDAMAKVVLDVLDDPVRFARISRGARALAEASAWPEVRARWVTELARLVPEVTLR